jgi:hypothetical protein
VISLARYGYGLNLRCLALFGWLLTQATSLPLQEPQLRIEAPPELTGVRLRLQSAGTLRLAGIAEFVGLTDTGPPIQVILATENSNWARQVPPWIVGFALGSPELVVVFPARSPGYPDTTLEDVLRHEITHVLIQRASGRGAIPRWFNEGLAISAERGWRFQDQSQLLYQLVIGPRTSLDELDRLFGGDRSAQVRAYALAGAFVRDLLQGQGARAPAEILMRVKQGSTFETAFVDVVGITPAHAESEFWDRQRIWTTWVPIFTSSATVWIVVTLLAIWAIRRHRQKNAQIEKRWEEDEDADQ